MNGLRNKVALISGVARGQGRSHALRLAEEGADIVGFDICAQIDSVEYDLSTRDDLDETVRLVEGTGRRIHAAIADVRDADQVRAVVEEGVTRFGRLDVVLANAGIFPATGDPSCTHTAFHDAVDVMLAGAYNTVMAGIPAILAGGRGGSVVVTSSAGGLKGLGDGRPGILGYVAAKHGVVGLMRAWANRYGPDGIQVNTVHPTGVRSPMIVNDAFRRHVAADPDLGSRLQNLLPVDLIDCVDVSNAIAFLCSDEGRYVSGQTFTVDAGFNARA